MGMDINGMICLLQKEKKVRPLSNVCSIIAYKMEDKKDKEFIKDENRRLVKQ